MSLTKIRKKLNNSNLGSKINESKLGVKFENSLFTISVEDVIQTAIEGKNSNYKLCKLVTMSPLFQIIGLGYCYLKNNIYLSEKEVPGSKKNLINYYKSLTR